MIYAVHTSLEHVEDEIELLRLLIVLVELENVAVALAVVEYINLLQYLTAIVVKRLVYNLPSVVGDNWLLCIGEGNTTTPIAE